MSEILYPVKVTPRVVAPWSRAHLAGSNADRVPSAAPGGRGWGLLHAGPALSELERSQVRGIAEPHPHEALVLQVSIAHEEAISDIFHLPSCSFFPSMSTNQPFMNDDLLRSEIWSLGIRRTQWTGGQMCLIAEHSLCLKQLTSSIFSECLKNGSRTGRS